jgi:thiamine biosynthesis protein ThiS
VHPFFCPFEDDANTLLPITQFYERKMNMKLTINGENVTLDKPTTVSEYLAANGYKPARIAVEINEVILPKDQYETHNLCEGDLVEIVTFMGGG